MVEKGSGTIDAHSVQGRSPRISQTAQILVVGAGPAGIHAAIAAARAGARVLLVDENPVAPETMGMDVPMHFGARFQGRVRNRSAMEEEMLRWQPLLVEAFEAGVDIRLGTAAWGIYANGPDVAWLPKLTVGLLDSNACWLVACDRVIVAAGRRDAGLAFPGWEAPGVMGLTAAVHLATCYEALDVRRVVILGTSAEALAGALVLRGAGVEIAALVEVWDAPIGPKALVDDLVSSGTQLLVGSTLAGAEAEADGVTAARIRALGEPGVETVIACDAILLGVRMVPQVELLAAAGCRTQFTAARGGHVPVLRADLGTSIPGLYAAGDCAGLWDAKTQDDSIAATEGRAAAHAALVSLGLVSSEPHSAAPPPTTDFETTEYWTRWVRATLVESGCDPVICQCESVTARDIMAVRPPRYLGGGEGLRGYVRALSDLAPPSPDQVKRLTRAGMGLCQGRRCREQTAALIAEASGRDFRDIPLATYRAPVRPIPLSRLADLEEQPEMSAHWDSWFGMPKQFEPFWESGPLYRAADRETGAQRGGE